MNYQMYYFHLSHVQTVENITLMKPNYIDPNEKRAVKIQAGNKNEYFIIEYYAKRITSIRIMNC